MTVTVNLTGAGTVNPGSGRYEYGTTIILTERTNPGYTFDGWYVNGVYEGRLSSIVLEITQDYNVQAVFSVKQLSLTITANPSDGGSIVPGIGIWNFSSGNSVTVTQTPNPGFTFSGWYLDGIYKGAGTGITVIMTFDHQLTAFYAGSSTNPTPQPTPVPTPTPTPQPTQSNLPTPSLTFFCTSSSTSSGFNVNIEGSLSYNTTALSGAGVLLSYSVTNGATWQNLAYVTTDDFGDFTCIWMPTASGNYAVKAAWAGDAVYSSVSTTINFAITPSNNQQQNVFAVTSNSTLTSLVFDSTHDQLSFSVSGPSGTIGYAQVCIPKSLLPVASVLTATIDGQTTPYSTFLQTDVWLITIHYQHSAHSVVLGLNSQTSTPTDTPTFSASPTDTPTASASPSASISTPSPSTTITDTPESSPTPIPTLIPTINVNPPPVVTATPSPSSLFQDQSIIFLVIIVALVAVIATLIIVNRRKGKSAKTP